MQKAQNFGLVSSGILHNTWILHFICALPEFFGWYFKLSGKEPQNIFRFVAFLIWFILITVQTFLFCFADSQNFEETGNLNISPENNSSFINRLVLWWLNSILRLGATRDIEFEDLYELNYGSTSAFLVPLWENYWKPTMQGI